VSGATLWNRLLPPSAIGRTIMVTTLAYALAIGIFMAGGTIFLVRWNALSSTEVGVALSAGAGVALVGSAFLGVLVDRLGTRRVWLGATIVQAAGYATYPLVRGFGLALLLICGVALTEGLVTIARQTYTAGVFPPAERTRTMAYLRAASNVGIAVGALVASAALAVDRFWTYPLLALLIALMLLVVAVFIVRLPPAAPAPARSRQRAIRNYPYLAVSALSGVLISHATVLSVVLPLWVLSRTDAPKAVVAWCFFLNTVLTVLLQVTATRGAEDRRGATRAQQRAAAVLIAMCAILAVTEFTHGGTTIVLLIVGAALLTGGELLHSAGAWTLSIELAPTAQRGEYLAAFRLGTQAQTVVGPAGLTALIIGGGPGGWVVLAVILGAAAGALPAAVHRAEAAVRVRQPPESATAA
jgi:Na+/melibiose symporter-like transporter